MRKDPLVPASEAVRGRYSEEFLRAVDWALTVNEDERPQDVVQWRDAIEGGEIAVVETGDDENQSGVSVKPEGKPPLPPQGGGKKGLGKALVLIAVVCALIGGVYFAFQDYQERKAVAQAIQAELARKKAEHARRINACEKTYKDGKDHKTVVSACKGLADGGVVRAKETIRKSTQRQKLLDIAKSYFKYGITTVNGRGGSYSDTPLILAATEGDVRAIRALIQLGADVNAKNDSGNTALDWAAWEGHAESIRELLKNGADKSIKDHSGSTAFDEWQSRQEGHPDFHEISILLRP